MRALLAIARYIFSPDCPDTFVGLGCDLLIRCLPRTLRSVRVTLAGSGLSRALAQTSMPRRPTRGRFSSAFPFGNDLRVRGPSAACILQAGEDSSRWRRPAARERLSRPGWLEEPAGASRAVPRASRQYHVLAHGPLTVTCTRRHCADEIETSLAVST